MSILSAIIYQIGRLLRTMMTLRWKPVPFFGPALLAVWLYWIVLAIFR